MDKKYLNLLKKYWPVAIAILFALAIALELIQRDDNQYTVNNQNSEVKLSEGAQDELWGFYNKAQDFRGRENPAINKSTATFLAVGDIMLSRNVAQKVKDANDPLLPFHPLTPLFQSVDFSFGNLESPFSGKDTFNSTGSMVFNAPRDNIKGLVENKFKILNLANNHALDQGAPGLDYTIKYLDENNIKHIGVGLTLNDAWMPAVIEQNGVKICFIGASYASINDSGKTTNDYVARIEDLDRLKSSILNLKSTCDFIVASMHAGTEYTTKPNQSQIDFAHKAIDFGADMVIGAHPHWVQTIEKYCPTTSSPPFQGGVSAESGRGGYGCKYIFYSLGNFIFDQMWSQETREGLTLKIQISKSNPPAGGQNELQGSKVPASLDSVELIPIIIDNYSTPRLADEKETKKILERIGETNTVLK